MALSDAARKNFTRAVAEMRRGRLSSAAAADDLLARLALCGLEVTTSEPDLTEMAEALQAAGYQVVPP